MKFIPKFERLFNCVIFGTILLFPTKRYLCCGNEVDTEYKVEEKELPVNAHRSKRLGDQAFYDGDYAEAIKYYKQYKKDTSRVADELALAYEALITSYINAYDSENAIKELNHYIVEVGVSVEILDYFNAEIFRIKKEYDKAIPLYLKVLKVVRPTNHIYFSALNGLGLSYEATNNWDQAIIAYGAIEEQCPKSSWRQRAMKQKIFAMIMANKFDEVEKLLKNPPKMRKDSDKVDMELFRIFMLAKRQKFLELDMLYKKVQGEIQVESYALCYKIDMLIAQLLIDNKQPKAAVNYLRDAYTFATNAFERQKALKTLINVYVAINDNDAAVGVAERFLAYYADSKDVANIRLQLARLLFSMGRVEHALKNYDILFNAPKTPLDIKVTVAKEVAFIRMDQKRFDLAISKLNFVFENGKSSCIKGEAKYYLAKILYLQKNDSAAYTAFIKVANTYKEWREKSLLQALYALDRAGENKHILVVANHLIKEYPKSEAGIEARYFKAIAHSKLGESKIAIDELLRFIDNYPTNKLIPRALFTVAGLSFDAKNYSDCTRFYSELIAMHKNDEIVPNALYKRMFSLYFLGKFDEALNDIETLAKDYKNSKYTLYALNFLADHYVNQKEYEKADKVLQRVANFYKADKSVLSKALLDRATVLLKSGKDKEATEIVEKIINEYSDQDVYVEALYLLGNIYSDKGLYAKAIVSYTKVLETAKDNFLKEAAQGRIGDCNFSLYSAQYKTEYLEKAISMYNDVLKQTDITRNFRLQTLYKIGKCFELLGFEKKAINSYKELMFDYKSDSSESTLWFVKAVNALASIHLKKGTPEGGKAAILLYRELIKYGIQPIDDYKSEIIKIKSKYKL